MAAQEHQKHPPIILAKTRTHTHTHISLHLCIICFCICAFTHTSAHTHTRAPSPFECARLAGGDLPLLGGFPGCLINYPSPIVYQEAEVETRGERRLKMATVRWRDPFPCQCGGGGYGEKGSKRESRAVKRA